jgi:hypothetical protein
VIFGDYGSGHGGGRPLPRVVRIGVTRPLRSLPRAGEPLPLQIMIREESTALTWVRNVVLSPAQERALVDETASLVQWSRGLALTARRARTGAERLGRRLQALVLGGEALAYVQGLRPTAILLDVDETVLDLPWELLLATDAFGLRLPMGRIITTQTRPAPRRDPLREDRDVVLLAVANPTADLGASTLELEALQSLAGRIGSANVVVEVLAGPDATRARLAKALRDGRVDILHFAGHARFDERRAGASALVLADGELRADDVLRLRWKAPPYLVFDSACESGRGSRGQRLVSRTRRTAGLPAAFLAAGVQGYVGHFFSVPDAAAATVAQCFYDTMLKQRSVGAALTEARGAVLERFETASDPTCFGLTYFGDVGGDERPTLPMAM